jgi:hypothetical protein
MFEAVALGDALTRFTAGSAASCRFHAKAEATAALPHGPQELGGFVGSGGVPEMAVVMTVSLRRCSSRNR